MTFRKGTLATALRCSLLASLGLIAVACGGTTDSGEDGTPTKRKLGQCTNPVYDPATQLTTCDEGYVHRETPAKCDGSGTSSDPAPGAAPLGNELCGTEDCSTLHYGYCAFNGGEGPRCASGCIEDSDCGAGQVCSCTGRGKPFGGECVAADCTTDADCDGGLCAPAVPLCGASIFKCQTKDDECQTNDDCPNSRGCIRDLETGVRTCNSDAVCGRPFLVAAEARLPPVVARGDWSDALAPRVDHLTFAQRSALAEHWTHLGQMEHASIAAFARFSLQLLSLGAPPELVEACTAALADETAHAKLCFGIASAYAGRAIGPGPLDVSRSLDVASLADIVDLVILEGCIGETTAALDALEAAQTATDPVICDAYLRIATDEQRHAELAFRFVQWAVATAGEAIEARVASALGALPSGAATDEVVRPCLSALCRGTTRAA